MKCTFLTFVFQIKEKLEQLQEKRKEMTNKWEFTAEWLKLSRLKVICPYYVHSATGCIYTVVDNVSTGIKTLVQ